MQAPGRNGILFAIALFCGFAYTHRVNAVEADSKASANPNAPILEALKSEPEHGGFCVQLGIDDPGLAAELAATGHWSVHLLDAEPARVEAARRYLDERNLYGVAAAETWNESFLPYADNLVNVLVVEAPGRIPIQEMLRVVAPLGMLYIRQAGGWQTYRKEWPAGLDEWTHWRHDASGNMVSRDSVLEVPTGLRWIAGPAQDPGGQKWYYDHVMVSAAGRNFYLYESNLVARDAFNGRLLWSREVKTPIFRETGTFIGLQFKTGNRTSKVRPVATAQRVYVVLSNELAALDAASGKTVQVYGQTTGPREIALAENLLLLSDTNGLRAWSPDGTLQWRVTEAARRMVVGDGKLFYFNSNNIVGLDLAGGKELWRTFHTSAVEAVTGTYGDGVLILERSSWRDEGQGSGVTAFSGRDGALLWSKDYVPGMTHYKEARAFFAAGLVWLEMAKGKLAGLDPRTGERKKEFRTRGEHCATPIATERFFIAPELEFTSFTDGTQWRARMVKSACRLPFVPANGLLYTFPVQCECFPMLRGYMGLCSYDVKFAGAGVRLQQGPAFGRLESRAPSQTDWPIYRHDMFRSGSTPQPLPHAPLKILWQTTVGRPQTNLIGMEWADHPYARGDVTPPVCAQNTLVVAETHRHRVVALDADTGAVKWNFIAGGRVDTPPSITAGACVFGAHDGYIYCLRLEDGQLAWRFRAAPEEARIAVHAQMESRWPVAGSLLALDGIVYYAAGRHPASDGGVKVGALEVASGRLVWEQTVTNTGVRGWYGAVLTGTPQKIGYDYEPVDLLVMDDGRVAMSRWQFDPKTGRSQLSVASTNYLAFQGLIVPRGIWGYGIRQTKKVQSRPPAAFDATRIVYGSNQVTAVLLASTNVVVADAKGHVSVNSQSIQLESPAVHDGLILARGRLYVTMRNGRVCCIGAE